MASLRTIQFALDEGLLTRFEYLVIADVFGDLIEQADYLLDQNYFLAAGVIFRAVLEERLLRMCERNTCAPEKKKSTINSYNMALYAAQPRIYDKGIMQNVTSLATIGNNAAHNSDELKMEDVDRLPGNCFFTPDVWLLAEAGILEGVQRNPKEITGLTSNP